PTFAPSASRRVVRLKHCTRSLVDRIAAACRGERCERSCASATAVLDSFAAGCRRKETCARSATSTDLTPDLQRDDGHAVSARHCRMFETTSRPFIGGASVVSQRFAY